MEKKTTRIVKGKKRKWKRQHALETDSNLAGMLEFKTIIINMLMDKVDSRQEQMYSVSREVEILRKKQKKG